MSESIPDYYAVLGVARSAAEDEIHRAYRRLVRLLHPDLNPDKGSFLEGSPDIALVNEAWEVLGDPESRTAYDRVLQPPEGVDEEAYFDVELPQVPEGFYLHPRTAWTSIPWWYRPRSEALNRAARWYRHRIADALKLALSLVAESPDLSNLSALDGHELWLLDLMHLPVTDSDIRTLTRFRSLEVLLLDDSAVTDSGVEWLRQLPSLRTVSLTGCRVTDRGMPALTQIPSLQNLEVDQTGITDAGLAAFGGHSALVVLDIRRTNVRGEGLEHLVSMPALRELRVSGRAERAARSAFRGRPEVLIL